MPPILNSINKRIFFTLGILVVNIGFVSILSVVFLHNTRSIGEIGKLIDGQRIRINQLINTDLDVLRFESVSQPFYETGESKMIRERDSLWMRIRAGNNDLRTKMEQSEFLIDFQFHRMDSLLVDYSETFRLLLKKINERGFKDFGQEGAMRRYAHELETTGVIPATDYLTLRRHEKDFLLRKESRYIDEFNEAADRAQVGLEAAGGSGVALLNDYRNAFNKLCDLNYEIGITPGDGILGRLNVKTREISRHLEELSALSELRIDSSLRRTLVVFSVTAVITVALSVLLTFYTSARLASPIKKLSNTMGKFMVNEGLNEDELKSDEETNEIANLSQAFIKLSRKLKTQFAEIQSQNRELKKLNDELDRFIYSAAHDLKSPLASMEGLVLLAEKEIDRQEYSHYFRMMITSLRKLEGFIGDITDYARNKRQQIKSEPTDVEAELREVIEGLRFLPNGDRIEVNLRIVVGCEFHTDKTRLGIILKNLLSNAFRYLDLRKQVHEVSIQGRVTEQSLVLRITDNGIGIDERHLPRIFDMFYRAVEHSQGTGIGLFLVRETVRMLNGRIAAKSKLGEWTTFYLSLPNLRRSETTTGRRESTVSTAMSTPFVTAVPK